jgi:transcriptional regulator with XRE-family HTH domain
MHAMARLIDDVTAAQGWKPADVARRTGLSTSRISQFRTKPIKGVPDRETIIRLARGLGVPPWAVMDAILESLGLPTRPTYIGIEEAVAADVSLDSAGKRAVLAFVEHVRREPGSYLNRVHGRRLVEDG